jgi:hypothetical protein|nr:MAG TPA: hypothetical protein [Caudoviricetes sp.]
MNIETINYNNKKYIKEVTLYFNDKNKNDFVNDVDECLKRKEINADVLFIALIETARDVCRVIDADFNDYLKTCIELGSVDDYFD